MWSVTLNGTDITAKVVQVQVSFAAGNTAGGCTVDLADRAALDGIVVPRVPREKLISVDKGDGSPAMEFYLESIDYPQDLNAKTASIWGRSDSAGLYLPRAQKISKQWPTATTINAIAQELADLCGVSVTVQNDYPVCAYCYAVSDQYPSEILQDLATKSGQIFWPQADGSLVIAPRLYRNLPDPVVTLTDPPVLVESVTREVPDFGNRILVSGDGAVAGLSVQVVPLADDDACVVADGQSTVRLIAIVLGADGLPVALGTVVTWTASSGLMSAPTSETADVVRQGEVHQADDYRHMTLDLPAESVIGCYRRTDVRRARNYYTERGGSVDGRVITFSAPLDYYDQTLVVDYIVQGAPITWVAGRIPGDVTVLGSVAGAQGFCTIHQSNPKACSTQISLEASPSNPCLGDSVAILLKTIMFGGPGVGAAVFGLQGCGSLSSTRKSLAPRTITETLRTSVWGGAVEVRLSAVPIDGTTPSVVLTETPGSNLYESHQGQVVVLSDDTILPGTQVTVTYVAGGTALIAWLPSALPSGNESITETLLVTHSGTAPDIVAQVTLSRTPVAAPSCLPTMEISNFYSAHEGKVVTLLEDGGIILPVGTQVQCSYQSVWLTQPGCSAIITVEVEDGSEDGGKAQLSVSARDCRTVNPTETYDPEDPDQIPDEDAGPEETGDHDPTSWLEPEEPEDVSSTSCLSEDINERTPVITAKNHDQVFASDCSSPCTCDDLCKSLRSTGRLSTEGGMTWATCMEACADARAAKCTQCVLSGPTTLAPGAIGTWTDGKGNNGQFLGGSLAMVERTPAGGYKAVMPTGGAGPFTIKVCYGPEESTCCEAQVAFPECVLEGPNQLEPGVEGFYNPSLGMTGATVAVGGEMTFVRNGPYGIGFVAKMNEGACNGGTVSVSYGGRVCGSINVASSLHDFEGYIDGPTVMDQSEMAYFSHNLGPGATYNGTLPLGVSGPDGATLVMPSDAEPNSTYTASWTGGICGKSASITVTCLCVPENPGGAYNELVYPINHGPVWTYAYNITVVDNGIGVPHGSWWYGVRYSYGPHVWIAQGGLLFARPAYVGACE